MKFIKKEIFINMREEKIHIKDLNSKLSENQIVDLLRDEYPILEDSSFDEDFKENQIVFTPFSELPYFKLYDYILDENFGVFIEETNALATIKTLPFENQIIFILNMILRLEQKRVTYSEASKLITPHISTFNNDSSLSRGDKPIPDLEDPLTKFSYGEIMDNFMVSVSFFDDFFKELVIQLDYALNFFYNLYSLDDYKELLYENLSVINQNNESFQISILIFDLESWKKLVINELSLSKTELEKKLLKRRFVCLVLDLKKRLNLDRIPVLSRYLIEVERNFFNDEDVDNGELDYNEKFFFYLESYLTKSDFTMNLDVYTEFLHSISLDKIQLVNKTSLIDELSSRGGKKIKLTKSPHLLLKVIKLFFINNMVVINKAREKQIKRFIINRFNFERKIYDFNTSEKTTISFFYIELTKRLSMLLYLLNEEGFIEYKNASFVYQLLIDEFRESNEESVGFSIGTLKPLFSELKNKNLKYNIANQVGFDSLTHFRSILS